VTSLVGPHTAAGLDCLTGSVARPVLGDCCTSPTSSAQDGAGR
jgi:hypothetical protein